MSRTIRSLYRVLPASLRMRLHPLVAQLRRLVRRIRFLAARLRRLPSNRTEWRALGDRWFDARVVGSSSGRRLLLLVWRLRVRVAVRRSHIVREALALGRRLARKAQPETAIAVYLSAEEKLGKDPDRLLLTVQRAALELRLGTRPADLWDRVEDLLHVADDALTADDTATAGRRLQEAFNLAFHRTFHFEDEPSPLAADPDTFLAPFRRSTAFQQACRPTNAVRTLRSVPGNRPRRLLFTTFMNWNFVEDIVADYRATPGVEVRTLDLRDIPDGPWRAQPVDLVQRRLAQAVGQDAIRAPEGVMEAFEWADTIFVEWGHRALPWVSMLQGVDARVVARIHSYEAFTPMPMHTDWSGIDDLVFVSPHIRALVEASVPALQDGPRLHCIPNRNEFSRYQRPKHPAARWTLGLVGWNNVTKDPMWAVEVLEHLRRRDRRWRLRLVGHNFPRSNLTGPAAAYRDELEARLDALGDAVDRPGFTDDVPEALRHIGVILSTSRREGTHEGLLQGAASGAVPVVRNWPYVARWGGARTIVPDDWVVETPEEAASLVLELCDGPAFERRASEVAEWTVRHYDWSVVRPHLDELLLKDV